MQAVEPGGKPECGEMLCFRRLTRPHVGPLIWFPMTRISKSIVATFLGLAALGSGFARAGDTNRLDGVAAIVNDKWITEQQVHERIDSIIPELQSRYAGQPRKYYEELAKIRSAALESLIENQLILSDFKKSGFNLPETLVDDQFQQYMVSTYGDRLSYVNTLQKMGKTIEEAKKEFRDGLIINVMTSQKVRNQTTISPYKIQQYYQTHQDKFTEEDRVKLRMIIIPAESRTDSAAIDKAKNIHKQIVDGASFEDMAKKYSVGVQAKDGGMMGWNTRKELRKELVEAAFSLEAGAVSQPIVTDDAVFILKAEEIQKKHVQPLSDVRDEIEQTLKAEENALRRKQWIDSIRAKSFVRLF